MDDIEIPQLFICPISLQIMKDPVTTITGITYDRESIEKWFLTTIQCPVTKQALPKDSDLTPNHTVRRVIQAWCMANAVDRIPTPKPQLDKFYFIKLLKDLRHPRSQLQALKKLEAFAMENEKNQRYMIEANVDNSMLSNIVSCYGHKKIEGLKESLNVLHLIGVSKNVIVGDSRVLDSLTWVLETKTENKIAMEITWVLETKTENKIAMEMEMKSHAVEVIERIIENTSCKYFVETLKLDFFCKVVGFLKEIRRATHEKIKIKINSCLNILLEACSSGRNRILMVQSGLMEELIEIELNKPGCETTELVFKILCNLCCCADGRSVFKRHKSATAVVAKTIARVSPVADGLGVTIIGLICKFSSGNSLVVKEMENVGVVSKLCILLQAPDCCQHLKDQVRDILNSHFEEWKNDSYVRLLRCNPGIKAS